MIKTLLNKNLLHDCAMQVNLSADDLGEYEFDGYASAFGSINSYGYTIDSGAFTKTLKENANPVLLWQHDRSEPVGRILTAEEDKKGLKIRGGLVQEVDRARAAYALMKADVLRGLSIGFIPIKEVYEQVKGIVHITEAKLMEVSIVTFAADPKAQVSRVLSELNMLLPNMRGQVEDYTREDIEQTIARLNALLDGMEPGQLTPAAENEPQRLAALLNMVNQITETQRRILL